MKWFTCLNATALDRYAEHLRVAVRTAADVAGLEPHIVFDGEEAQLRAAVGFDGFRFHRARSGLVDDIATIEETPKWRRATAAGALLRLEIPRLETSDDFVLYTDCDVLFTRRVELSALRPRFFGAAPMHEPHDWSQMCSGVLLLNLPAMRAEHEALMRSARALLPRRDEDYDQSILNEHFRGRWDHLPLEMHWKPYWGVEPQAAIVHFHGPKAEDARRLAQRGPSDDLYGLLYARDPAGYAHYLRFYDAAAAACRADGRLGAAALAPLRLETAAVSARRALGRALVAMRELRPAPAREGVAPPAPQVEGFEPARLETFDERAYLYANPDVAEAVRRFRFSSGRAHFLRHGRHEGRLQMLPTDVESRPETFDEAAYLARNPDVAFLIARGRFASARAHFERRGRKERRRQLAPAG